MAELLIRSVDNVRPNSETPELSYRLGDVVHIGEDGHEWGRKETPENGFNIIYMPGISADKLKRYIQIETYDEDPPEKAYDPDPGYFEKIPVRRRQLFFDKAKLSPRISKDLEANGYVVCDDQVIMKTMVDKNLNQTEWEQGRRIIDGD